MKIYGFLAQAYNHKHLFIHLDSFITCFNTTRFYNIIQIIVGPQIWSFKASFATQTDLYSLKNRLEAWNFGFKKRRDCTIRVVKTKALISVQLLHAPLFLNRRKSALDISILLSLCS